MLLDAIRNFFTQFKYATNASINTKPIVMKFPIVAGCLLFALLLSGSLYSHAADKLKYHVNYSVELKPSTRSARVEIQLAKRAEHVRWIRLKIDPSIHSNFKGVGLVEKKDNTVMWTPDVNGGSLFFDVKIDHRRKSGRFDALFTKDWAIFRGDDLIPPAHVVMADDTSAKAKLNFELPEGWSVVTPYPRYTSGAYKIEHIHRRFDRPTGWMIAGKLGVKREKIEGINVIVAAPKGQKARRMDILAHLNWNLPSLLKVFPQFTKRLLIVSAGDPMWRGGLSGPSSLYIHVDRPLISDDGTSPLIHELIHVAMSARSAPGADWLVEGLAEFYSLEIMYRSGTITQKRYDKAHSNLVRKGRTAERMDVKHARGAVTAKAVGILKALDSELRSNSHGSASLDDIVQELVASSEKITLDRVRNIAQQFSRVKLQWNPQL